jgi:hemolysin III
VDQIDPKEERLNVITHALGAILAGIGFVLLLVKNSNKTEYATLAVVLFGLSAVILFTSSTLYHAASGAMIRRKWRIMDHVSIYLLIAGTYSPMALISLEQGNGWLIFGIVWTIAMIGAILKLFFTGRFGKISLALYLAMGWLVVFDFKNLKEGLSAAGLELIFLGGAFYTLGAVFYAIKKIPYNHAIWHVFVLAGWASHWAAIYFEVV